MAPDNTCDHVCGAHQQRREKASTRVEIEARPPIDAPRKGDSQLPIRLRRLRVQRTDGKIITLLTNDLARAAVDIATLYKARWQIELLFRWIKQHLRIRRFLGNNDNAIRLQIFAAMIAYALLRIAARRHCVKLPILRFTDLVALCLFERRHLGAIEKPPLVNPGRRQCQTSQNQLSFGYV